MWIHPRDLRSERNEKNDYGLIRVARGAGKLLMGWRVTMGNGRNATLDLSYQECRAFLLASRIVFTGETPSHLFSNQCVIFSDRQLPEAFASYGVLKTGP